MADAVHHHDNHESHEDEQLTAWQWLFILFIGGWLLQSIICNSLVVVIVLKKKKMRNITNYYICNLAVSDIVLAMIVIPMRLHDISHTDEFHEGALACKIINVLPILCIVNSIYSMVCISYERHHSIALCLSSSQKLISNKAGIAASWVMAFVTAVPSFVEYNLYERIEGNHSFIGCGTSPLLPCQYSPINGFFVLFVAYIIPLIIILANYSRLFAFIWRQAKVHPGQPDGTKVDSQATSTSHVSKNKVKVIKMLSIATGLFAVCWLPYFVLVLIAKITGADDATESDGAIQLILICLSTFSVCNNTFLYIIYNAGFREGFREFCCCCCLRMKREKITGGITETQNNPGMSATRYKTSTSKVANEPPHDHDQVNKASTSNQRDV